MRESREFAVTHLAQMVEQEEMDLFLKFRLGMQSNKTAWARAALEEIIQMSTRNIDASEAELIGLHAYRAILHARQRLLTLWGSAAVTTLPHPIHCPFIGGTCPNKPLCYASWKTAWRDGVVHGFARGDEDLTDDPTLFVRQMECPGMHADCQAMVADTMVTMFEKVDTEELVDAVMEELKDVEFEMME